MNLKNTYEQTKAMGEVKQEIKGIVTTVLAIIVTYAALGLFISFLYNYIAPIWSLTKLSYLQTIAIIFLLKITSFILYNGKK